MEDTTTATPALPPRVGHVLRLAEIIGEVGGITPHGAAALAEGILEHPGFSGCHDGPAAQPADQAEGPSLADVDQLCAEFSFHYEDGDSLEILQEMITAAITRWRAPVAQPVALPPLPAQDPGQVAELLEFLDSLAASPILTFRYTAQLRRVAEVLKGIPDMSPATPAASPAAEELTRFATWLRSHSSQCVELGRPDWAHMADRAADLLEGFSRGGSAAPTVEQATTPPPLPPDYIDPEHQGKNRELLEAFYGAWQPEGGTTDEKVLRSIRAVLALRPTVAAVRAADAAIADEALEAEFRAWWKAQGWHDDLAAIHVVLTHVAWGRHLLSRGEL